jgi:hypothetical protein
LIELSDPERFGQRAFAIHGYPVNKVEGLRPGMSVYTDWRRRTQ